MVALKARAIYLLGWLGRILISLDQLANVLICDGEPDETMSSNAYRMRRNGGRWGFLCLVINVLAWPLQRDHCRKAYESELLRLQYPMEFQKNGSTN